MNTVADALPQPWGLIISAIVIGAGGAIGFIVWLRKTIQNELTGVHALMGRLEAAIKSLEDTRNAQTSFFAQQGVLMEKSHAISMEALKASEATQGYAASLQAQMEEIRRGLSHGHRVNGSGYSDP